MKRRGESRERRKRRKKVIRILTRAQAPSKEGGMKKDEVNKEGGGVVVGITMEDSQHIATACTQHRQILSTDQREVTTQDKDRFHGDSTMYRVSTISILNRATVNSSPITTIHLPPSTTTHLPPSTITRPPLSTATTCLIMLWLELAGNLNTKAIRILTMSCLVILLSYNNLHHHRPLHLLLSHHLHHLLLLDFYPHPLHQGPINPKRVYFFLFDFLNLHLN